MPFEHPLAREIAAILVIKLALIAALGFYFFGPDTKPRLDEQTVAKAVLERPELNPLPPEHRSAK